MQQLEHTLQVNGTLVSLASVMRILFAQDASAVRATERAVEMLEAELPYSFDGVELRIGSTSQAHDGVFYVTDGISCTCPGSKREWCKHRALYRLLLAQWALAQPAYLRAMIVEQVAVEDTAWDTTAGFLSQIGGHSIPWDFESTF